jgi:hypothetical protein
MGRGSKIDLPSAIALGRHFLFARYGEVETRFVAGADSDFMACPILSSYAKY